MILQVVDLVKEPRRHVPKVGAVLLVGFFVGKRGRECEAWFFFTINTPSCICGLTLGRLEEPSDFAAFSFPISNFPTKNKKHAFPNRKANQPRKKKTGFELNTTYPKELLLNRFELPNSSRGKLMRPGNHGTPGEIFVTRTCEFVWPPEVNP